VHYCLGAALARVDLEVVFGGLLNRFSSIELAAFPGCAIGSPFEVWRR
jgi:cytochrome P450